MAAKKKTVKKTKKKVSARGRSVGSATAAAILGNAIQATEFVSGKAKVKTEWKKHYKTLLSLHAQLLEQMDGLAKESTEEINNYSLHMADSGTDNFDRDFALSLLSSDQDAIYEIEEALKRIEKGTYGVCEITGKPIPKARLDAIPWTRFTVESQAQLEKDGAVTNRRLGNRGSVDSSASFDSDDDDFSDDKSSKD